MTGSERRFLGFRRRLVEAETLHFTHATVARLVGREKVISLARNLAGAGGLDDRWPVSPDRLVCVGSLDGGIIPHCVLCLREDRRQHGPPNSCSTKGTTCDDNTVFDIVF